MAEDFAQRSLVVYKIWVHKRRKPNELLDLTSIREVGIGKIFENFIASHEGIVHVGNTAKYLMFTASNPCADGVLAKYSSGNSGEQITMVDPDLEEVLSRFGSDKAPMVDSRVYLRYGFGISYALICVEHVQGSAGDTAIFGPLRDYVASSDSDYVLKWEAVTEAEAISHFSGVETIEVKRYLRQKDLRDSAVCEANCISTVLTHRRNRRFSLASYKAALADWTQAVSLFGLMPMENLDEYEKVEVYFKLRGKDGKDHRFFLNEQLDVKVQEVLNEKGRPPLTDEGFLDVCESRCDEIQSRLGRSLQYGES